MEPKLEEQRIEEALKFQLELRSPEFHLEILPSGSISGSIISDSFAGVDDLERQRRIWNVLDEMYGKSSAEIVGTLLAYSRAEWDWDDDSAGRS